MGGDTSEETVLKRCELEEDTISVSDLLDKLCPYYMSIGMSYDEYWHGDNYAYKYYAKAHELKVKYNNAEMDYKCWLTGLYTYEAICDCSPILHDFAKKGTKPMKYVAKPIFATKEINNQIQHDKEIKNGRLAFRVQMENWMRATQRQFTNKKKGGSE